MNENRKKTMIRLVWLASVGGAFLLGALLAGQRFLKVLPRLSNSITYNDHVHSASNYAQALLDARKGDTNAVIRRLEKCADASLLMTRGSTDSYMRVIEDGPWTQLKKDRMEHPRESTTPERDRRINEMLDMLIKEQPQQRAAPVPPAPETGPSEGAR